MTKFSSGSWNCISSSQTPHPFAGRPTLSYIHCIPMEPPKLAHAQCYRCHTVWVCNGVCVCVCCPRIRVMWWSCCGKCGQTCPPMVGRHLSLWICWVTAPSLPHISWRKWVLSTRKVSSLAGLPLPLPLLPDLPGGSMPVLRWESHSSTKEPEQGRGHPPQLSHLLSAALHSRLWRILLREQAMSGVQWPWSTLLSESEVPYTVRPSLFSGTCSWLEPLFLCSRSFLCLCPLVLWEHE